MKKFSYCLINSEKSKEVKKENFFEGERILYKCEETKLQDEYELHYIATTHNMTLIYTLQTLES